LNHIPQRVKPPYQWKQYTLLQLSSKLPYVSYMDYYGYVIPYFHNRCILANYTSLLF